MAFSSNPKFVTEGLGLALDANDINSQRTLREVEVMVVGGGGGGGMDMGGGGGGGGVLYQPNFKVSPGTGVTVTVGAGGYGAPAGNGGYRTDGAGPQPSSHQFTIRATNGGDSAFGTLVAKGGGYGGSSYYGYTPDYGIGGTGASGGGNSGYTAGATTTAPVGTVGQGYRGGNAGGGSYYSGGGGGAGAPGADGPNTPHGGAGIIIPRMSPFYYGGGGGGSSYSGPTGGNGGLGGGGGGAAGGGGSTVGSGDTNGRNAGSNGGLGNQQPGGNAGANTGGGGGGGSHYNVNNKGGEGGSGIVIVRYNGPQAASGGTYSFSNGVSYHTFTSSGTFTPYTADGTGTTWYDVSGNGLNAATAKFYTAHGGRDQKALRSDANDVDTPSTSLLNTDYHSIFMIIRFIATSSYPDAHTGSWQQFFGFYGGGSDRTPGVWRYPSNRIIHWRYDPSNSGCDFLDYYGAGEFAVNRDYFIGVTKNGSTATPYVDGVAVPIYSGGSVSNPKTAGNSVIRMFDYYTSEIMEIKGLWIYNRALSAAEVRQNYNAIRTRLIK
jgi:hypothetical protein